ncbi:MAG: BatA and WFA domain-containing protein [Candidatus Kapabacteria bacterium]|nr:BatA and WFA domain-containing protein [Candidatus Kapabacteria bacterium]
MTFLNPLVLLGLLASAIPIILHFLNLRKLKTIEFSTLRFLKELQKTKIRRLKIKQLILLILRILIITFIVLAFARPTIKSTLPGIGTYAKTSSVFVIDNSFSLDVSDEYGNRFTQAKNIVRTLLNNLKEGDEAALIKMVDDENINELSFTRNLELINEELQKTKISLKTANLESSLRKASALLEKSMNLIKDIYIITDAQPNVFFRENKDSLKLFDENTSVYFIPIGYNTGKNLQNLSIDSVTVITKIFQKDKPVEIEAHIRNHSEKEVSGALISLFINNQRLTQKIFDLPAKSQKTILLSALPPSFGANTAYVELENDALEYDNKRHFGFIIPEQPKIAIIGNGEKSRFISLVLSAVQQGNNAASNRFFGPEQIGNINFNDYDLVIFAGGPYKDSDFDRIKKYLENSGSVLFFADDLTNRETFVAGMNKLNISGLKSQKFPDNSPGDLTSIDKLHPLFEGVFKGTTDNKKVAEKVEIYQALSTNSGQSLIEIPGGSLVNEVRIGEGKLLYVAVTPDLKWSSLPLTGLFPAIIYRSAYYLSFKQEIGKTALIGVPMVFNLPKKYSAGGTFRVIDPKNIESAVQSVNLPSGALLRFDNNELAGSFIIKSQDNIPITILSVNTNPTESNINPLTEQEINNQFINILNKNVNFDVIEDRNNIIKGIERARTGTELWQLAIILALCCIIAEMLVAKSSKNESFAIENS